MTGDALGKRGRQTTGEGEAGGVAGALGADGVALVTRGGHLGADAKTALWACFAGIFERFGRIG